MMQRFYCPERTHFVPDGKPLEAGSLAVSTRGVVGRVRETRFSLGSGLTAFFIPTQATQGVWTPVAHLKSGDWAYVESCEDGGQI